MKFTKKAFREYLNQEDQNNRNRLASQGKDTESAKHKHNQYQQRTRLYGDYLYFQDKDKFDWEYEEWLKEHQET